jgi:hypothetical protein
MINAGMNANNAENATPAETRVRLCSRMRRVSCFTDRTCVAYPEPRRQYPISTRAVEHAMRDREAGR